MSDLFFAHGRSQAADILRHLIACDRGFVPPLSERVAIPEYARRLADTAARFEAWSGGELVGLVAAYCNAPDRQDAFISNVSVLPDWRKQGVAGRLVRDCIAFIGTAGFAQILLEVDANAVGAVRLYENTGFKQMRAQDSSLRMCLKLRKDDDHARKA